MIKSTKDNTFIERIREVVVVANYTNPKNLREYVKNTQAILSEASKIEFVFYVNEKSLPDMLPMFKGINYICDGDFNFFGIMKNDKLKTFSNYHTFDALFCSGFEFNKRVLKFVGGLKSKYRIGWNQRKLLNFDLAFERENKNEQELIELSVRYLKLL